MILATALAFSIFSSLSQAGDSAPAAATALGAHGCSIETADDRTGENLIDLVWSFTHSNCMVVRPGTTVRWNGNFAAHPLNGGISPVKDDSSPISLADIVDTVASVTFDTPGDFPYFCAVHLGNMSGVIYVAPPPPFFFKDGFEGNE